jgi:hypothetical protein
MPETVSEPPARQGAYTMGGYFMDRTTIVHLTD